MTTWVFREEIYVTPLHSIDFTVRASNHCAKFHQDRIKIAAVGVFTDGQTERHK